MRVTHKLSTSNLKIMDEDMSDVLEGTEIGAMHRGEGDTSCAANPFSVAMNVAAIYQRTS
jgi:hypothetical protein